MTKIILLNAPAGAGKDTLGSMLQTQVKEQSEVVKFASPLKSVAIQLYCNGDSRKFYEFDHDQEKKSKPDDVFLGKSCRQVQIDISEVYMKPMHGQQVFGKFLANYIHKRADEGIEVFFVTDSGFRPEAEVLVEEFGPQNILLVRIHREGHSYEGDSRNYIELSDLDVQELDLENITDDINTTLSIASEAVNKFISGN